MKKQKRKSRMGRTGKMLLLALGEGLDVLTASPRDVSRALGMGGMAMVRTYDAELRKDARHRAIKTLARNQFLRPSKKNSQSGYQLTEQGQILARRERIICTKKKLARGMLCLVSFDIPERERFARRTVRELLKEAEFKQYHASLWGTRCDVFSLLRELIHLLHIEEWIFVFEAKKRI